MEFESRYDATITVTIPELEEVIDNIPASRCYMEVDFLNELRANAHASNQETVSFDYIYTELNGDKEEVATCDVLDSPIDLAFWYTLEDWMWRRLNSMEVPQ